MPICRYMAAMYPSGLLSEWRLSVALSPKVSFCNTEPMNCLRGLPIPSGFRPLAAYWAWIGIRRALRHRSSALLNGHFDRKPLSLASISAAAGGDIQGGRLTNSFLLESEPV